MSVHKMRLDEKPFNMIKSGKKTVELRLYDEKRRKIHVGDEIIFESLTTGEALSVTVLDLHIYKNFSELYTHFEKTAIGYEENEKADPNDMNIYYSEESRNKYGVVGIEVVLNNPRSA